MVFLHQPMPLSLSDSKFQSHRVGEGDFNFDNQYLKKWDKKFQSHQVGEGDFNLAKYMRNH